MNIRLGQAESAFKKMKSILCSKYCHSNHAFVYSVATFIQFLLTAQKHGIYPKPWNNEFRHSRCGALGVCSKFHGEQKSGMKMSPGKLAIIQVC